MYDADSISTLEGLEAVRKRPGMFIGDSSEKGLHHLVQEVVDNSIDEAAAGHCDKIEITIHEDNSVSVEDNGRGIPIGKKGEKRAIEEILTELHSGGKFDNDSYQISGGLHGVGVSAVNALSRKLKVNVKRNGKEYTQTYKKGEKKNDLEEIGTSETTGTRIHFWPDPEVFDTLEFEYERLNSRSRELAFLNPGVQITVQDKRNDELEKHLYKGGLKEFIDYLNESREALHEEIINFSVKEENVKVEIAMQYTNEVQPSIHGYANNINTKEGGVHITGFKTALTRIINKYGKDNDMFNGIESVKGEDVRKGLTAIISVKHPDPEFRGQTKTKLGNSEVESITSGAMHAKFEAYLLENPNVAEKIVEKAIQSAKARKEVEKVREATMRDTALESTTLPGKLADCQSKDTEETELFLVEGDSAAGSAKQARDPETQAILSLKGKILNVEKHELSRILENNEIESIIQSIGAGIGEDFDIDDVRYGKIIIMCDADVDGAHIRSLVLTLLYRHMKPLIENGYVYATKPPLFRIKDNKNTYDVMSEEEKERVIKEECSGDPNVTRFKGLGEMSPKKLWNTTMNPESRSLKEITLEDGAEADKIFSTLMGTEVEPRANFIKNNADKVEWIDK